MLIIDWSSVVCSSDLGNYRACFAGGFAAGNFLQFIQYFCDFGSRVFRRCRMGMPASVSHAVSAARRGDLDGGVCFSRFCVQLPAKRAVVRYLRGDLADTPDAGATPGFAGTE